MKILVKSPKDWGIYDGNRPHVRHYQLTAREREILQLLSEGKTTKETAVELNIAVKTAETHRASIMRKLKIDSAQELVRYALRNRIDAALE